VAEHTIQWSK